MGQPDEASFFGPVIARDTHAVTRRPDCETVEVIATTSGMAELKRSLRDRPRFDLTGSLDRMSRPRRAPAPSTHRYPRTARLNKSLREVIAEELTRIDDERLDLVTITAIDVDSEMNRAIVFYDSLRGEDGDAEILEALNAHRVRIQGSIGRQVRTRRRRRSSRSNPTR